MTSCQWSLGDTEGSRGLVYQFQFQLLPLRRFHDLRARLERLAFWFSPYCLDIVVRLACDRCCRLSWTLL